MMIIVTPAPSFYKVRLFNEISKEKKIFVVFTKDDLTIRSDDFYTQEKRFDYCILKGNSFLKSLSLLKIIFRVKYNLLVLSGWDNLAGYIAAIISPKRKNACIVESSIYDSTLRGVKGFLKKLFLLRIDTVYASGKTQVLLVQALGFRDKIKVFGGCGILNYVDQPIYLPRSEVKKFLYVGRLSEEKNLKLLVQTFNDLPNFALNVIGFGPLEKELKSMAKDNIHFLGAIDNAALPIYYKESDVFILPSKSEVWGLVVEEALNNGTPVIVSDRVGCKDDLVTKETGIVFSLKSGAEGLRSAILKTQNLTFYNALRKGVSKLDFKERARTQVRTFVEQDN